MYILLACGNLDLSEQVAIELRTYYSYRNVACYIRDFNYTIEEAVEGVLLAIRKPSGSMGEGFEKDLLFSMEDFFFPYIVGIVEEDMRSQMKHWVENDLPHKCIIYGIQRKEHLEKAFPGAYKVLISNDNNGATSLQGSCDCAESMDFHHMVDPQGKTPKEIAENIGRAIFKMLESSVSKKELTLS